MIHVESSNISEIGWENNKLYVNFISTGTYEYLNVPRETYEKMLISDSKGSFFFRNIKPLYSGQKIKQGDYNV
jgi:hypothetical protein